jgi:hypothetical protein
MSNHDGLPSRWEPSRHRGRSAPVALGENGWAAGANGCGQLVKGGGGGPDPHFPEGSRENLPYLPSWAAGLAPGHSTHNGIGLRLPLAA